MCRLLITAWTTFTTFMKPCGDFRSPIDLQFIDFRKTSHKVSRTWTSAKMALNLGKETSRVRIKINPNKTQVLSLTNYGSPSICISEQNIGGCKQLVYLTWFRSTSNFFWLFFSTTISSWSCPVPMCSLCGSRIWKVSLNFENYTLTFRWK